MNMRFRYVLLYKSFSSVYYTSDIYKQIVSILVCLSDSVQCRETLHFLVFNIMQTLKNYNA